MNGACEQCKTNTELGFDITMAFQPIIDISTMQVFSYEALVRSPGGNNAAEVLSKVTPENQYKFDQHCRSKAIEVATILGVECYLSINFMPNAVYEPERCLGSTLKSAKQFGFPTSKIIFEFTENEEYKDIAHIQNITNTYKAKGFITAIDDFGEGFAGLKLAALTDTNIWKIDICLLKDIDKSEKKQKIVKGLKQIADDLGIKIVAEGVENKEEFITLLAFDITLYQGYFFARPQTEGLPIVDFALLKTIISENI